MTVYKERRKDEARASEIGKSEEMEVLVEWRVVERRDDRGSRDLQGLEMLKEPPADLLIVFYCWIWNL